MTGVLSQIEKDLEELKKKEEELAKAAPVAEEKPAQEPVEPEEAPEPEEEEPVAPAEKEDITPEEPAEPAKLSGSDAARERIERKKREQLLQEEVERERAEKREMALKLARYEGRDEVLRPAQSQQVDDDPMPEVDPFEPASIAALMQWQERQTMKKFAPIFEEVQQTKQHMIAKEAEGAWKEMNTAWQSEDRSYKKSYDFIIEKARDDLKAKNPNASDKQIESLLKQEEYSFVSDLSKRGMNVKQAIKIAAMELAEKDGIDFFSYVAEEKKTTPSDRSTPNLREVVENKKRSGSFMEVGAGTARPKVGAKEIASATLDELMSMKPEDFARARKEAAEMAKRGEVLRA